MGTVKSKLKNWESLTGKHGSRSAIAPVAGIIARRSWNISYSLIDDDGRQPVAFHWLLNVNPVDDGGDGEGVSGETGNP